MWSADSQSRLTTIGHLCREAIQEFAEALVETYKPEGAPPAKNKTKGRLQTTIRALKPRLGETQAALLEALVAYWSSVSDIVQKQEHGTANEDRPLSWEDARRCVFHTGVVMFEIDRALP